MLATGQLVGGRYRVEALIAQGGMGAVYRAIDERLARGVAIKIMHEGLAGDVTEATRFKRESAAVASLHHPGLVQVLDSGDDQGVPYLVMELVVGRTLASVLTTEGRLDPMRASDLVEQALFALSVAHGAGIVHRDLKPGNLMVIATGGRELVKVLDFGIAQLKSGAAYTRLTQTGAIIGTPSFMAPEQVRGEPCDARTDVYAMGVVLWCCLTGRKPFEAKDIADTILKVLGEKAPRADRLEARVPPALATAVEVAMSKKREDRFASAGAFAAALADLRSSRVPPVPDRPPTMVQTRVPLPVMPVRASAPSSSPISNSAILAALALLVALVIVLGCAVMGLAYHSLAPSLGASSPLAPGIPSLSGASGDACTRAADCCIVLLQGVGSGTSNCESVRGLSQYGPQAEANCQRAYEVYRDNAAQRGLRCE